MGNLNDVTNSAVVDLLGLLAYGELSSFEQMAADAHMAPTLFDKAQMSKFATDEFEHYRKISSRLTGLGVDPIDAMSPFSKALDAYHAQLVPSNWLEGLVKSYIGEGIAADFYREVSKFLDKETAQLVEEVLAAQARMELAQLFISKEANVGSDIDGLVNRLTVGHARRMDVLGFAS